VISLFVLFSTCLSKFLSYTVSNGFIIYTINDRVLTLLGLFLYYALGLVSTISV